MPRFYFHLRSANRSLMDCEGMVLADQAAAREEAVLTLRDFFQPALGQVDPVWEQWSIEAADERGRSLFAMPFAGAAEMEPHAPHSTAGERAVTGIVDLKLERARRELSAEENRTRRLLHSASRLADCTRYEAKRLHHLLQMAEEICLRSKELVARSQRQTWSIRGAPSGPASTAALPLA